MKRCFRLLLTVVFVLALAAPCMGWLVSSMTGTRNGKNPGLLPLTGFPELEVSTALETLQLYNRQAEKFFNQHFPGRQWLVGMNIGVKKVFFPDDVGPLAMVGRDGWLFFPAEGIPDAQLGLEWFTDEELHQMQKVLERRRDWLAAQGIEFLFVVAPNKGTIYPEHLPKWLKPAKTTRLDQFLNHMRNHSTVTLLDLRPVLRQAATRDALYYQADTHWNLMGGLTAAQGIAAALEDRFPNLKPIGRDDFEIRRRPGSGGDLANVAKRPSWPDNNIYQVRPKAHLPGLSFQSTATEGLNYTNYESAATPDPGRVTTVNSRQTTRVLFFGDSFQVGLRPFLGYYFGRVDYFLQDTIDTDAVCRVKPALVICEMVERRLGGGNFDPRREHLE